MQEARSFDNLFCGFATADGVCANHVIPLGAKCRLSDTFADYKRDLKTGNFGKEHADCPGYRRPEYAYVPKTELKPYYAIAAQYVLGDHMFSSTGNPTFEAHQYLIAAQASDAIDGPFGSSSDSCVYHQWVRTFKASKTEACFDYKTLGDELNEGGLTWSYYRTANKRQPIVDTWDAFGWSPAAVHSGLRQS
jgi:phospholipase C